MVPEASNRRNLVSLICLVCLLLDHDFDSLPDRHLDCLLDRILDYFFHRGLEVGDLDLEVLELGLELGLGGEACAHLRGFTGCLSWRAGHSWIKELFTENKI